ncbi:unnamed protein product [Rotaria sordida]|uniref:Uncharacterized protein n=2 Tax=Rotaria sordida TaxID=392033 RepID=A0A819PGX0_9BILA|nr:unnamed protein product [Rotaria sordida]
MRMAIFFGAAIIAGAASGILGEYARHLRPLIDSDDEKIRQRLFIDLNPERRLTPPLKNVQKRRFRKIDRDEMEQEEHNDLFGDALSQSDEE